MTNNVGLTFSVGDTTRWFTLRIEQEQLELVTPNITFSVLGQIIYMIQLVFQQH